MKEGRWTRLGEGSVLEGSEAHHRCERFSIIHLASITLTRSRNS